MTPRGRAWSRFARNRGALAGLVLVALAVSASLLAPWLDRHPPVGKDISHGLGPLGQPLAPSAAYPAGTDALGRCVAARVLHGGRVSLGVGVAATAIAVALGVLVGLVSGFLGGPVDSLLMRLVDLVLAFPFLLLVIALAAVLRQSGAGMGAVIAVLGLVSWTTMARVVRGKVLTIRELDYVQAARAVGGGRLHVLARHVLPNVVGPIVVLATISVAQLILAESTLSYLGLGVPPPIATWGRMLSEGESYKLGAPWLIVAPGIAILVTVLGFNLLGEGLRDALDPKDRRS